MGKLVVEKDNLVAVADAIREKGNTTDDLVFPEMFISAIKDIETGGGGIIPIGNLTDDLIVRKTSGAYHEATIPAGYYVNEDIVIHEWNSG